MFFNNRKCGCGCDMNNNMDMNYNMNMPMNNCPIMEPPIEKCVQKDIYHEVEHICPINTKIINNHIYKHVYIPQYTCTEEDVYTNMDECGCAGNYDFY